MCAYVDNFFIEFIRYIKREDRDKFQHQCVGLLGREPKNDKQGKCSGGGGISCFLQSLMKSSCL